MSHPTSHKGLVASVERAIGRATSAHVVIVGVLAVVLLLGAYAFVFRGAAVSSDPQHWGQLGDYLGGFLNPTIAFLALVGLWQSVSIQRRELAEVRSAMNSQTTLDFALRLIEQQRAALDDFRYSGQVGTEAVSLLLSDLGVMVHDEALLSKHQTTGKGALVIALVDGNYLQTFEQFAFSRLTVLSYIRNLAETEQDLTASRRELLLELSRSHLGTGAAILVLAAATTAKLSERDRTTCIWLFEQIDSRPRALAEDFPGHRLWVSQRDFIRQAVEGAGSAT